MGQQAMGQQAVGQQQASVWDGLNACALGIGRPGHEHELVTSFNSRENCNFRTPQAVLSEMRKDPSQYEKTVRRRLFDEEQALLSPLFPSGSPASPVVGGVAREAARRPPLALRLGFATPEQGGMQTPSHSPVYAGVYSPIRGKQMQSNFSNAARVGGA